MKKLTSRKFLACIVGIISGLALCFGADANIVTEIGGITATVFSIVSYIISIQGKRKIWRRLTRISPAHINSMTRLKAS